MLNTLEIFVDSKPIKDAKRSLQVVPAIANAAKTTASVSCYQVYIVVDCGIICFSKTKP
jgi:hypothetical protein